MSVERQTKEKFPKQHRLCEQRRSTVASIRSCPARLGVCGTCGGKIIYAKQKNARVPWNASVNFFAIILWVLLRLHLQQLQIHLLQQQELQLLHQLQQRERQLFPHPQQIAVLIAAFLLR